MLACTEGGGGTSSEECEDTNLYSQRQRERNSSAYTKLQTAEKY